MNLKNKKNYMLNILYVVVKISIEKLEEMNLFITTHGVYFELPCQNSVLKKP